MELVAEACKVLAVGPTSRHVTSRQVTTDRHVKPPLSVTSRHVTSRHVSSGHVTSRHVSSGHVSSRHVTSRHVSSRHVSSRQATTDRAGAGTGRVRCRRRLEPGLACTTASQTDFLPRLPLLGANWRPWPLKIKTVTIPKGGLHGRSCLSPNLGRQCIWAELQETGGLSATLAVTQLGRCRATHPLATSVE